MNMNLLKIDIMSHDILSILGFINHKLGENIELKIDIDEIISLIYSPNVLGLKPSDIKGRENGWAGLPEIDSKFILDMCKKTNVKSQDDLERVVAVAHSTNICENIEKLLTSKRCNLSDLPCYREDIMQRLMSHGIDRKTSYEIMECVRKGKGMKEEHIELLKKYNVPDYYIDCCKAILYLYPLAYVKSYITDVIKLAYHKIHNPKEFYEAYLHTEINKKVAMGVLKLDIEEINKKIKVYEDMDNDTFLNQDECDIKILSVLYEMKARNMNWKEMIK